MSFIRSMMVKAGYMALAHRLRLPEIRFVSDLRQWSCLFELLDRLQINVFVDVGANKGHFSRHLRMGGYRQRLISFEPIPADFSSIEQLAKDDPEWVPVNCALGAEDGTKAFNVINSGQESVLSSFLNSPNTKADSVINVKIARLDTLLPKLIADIVEPRIFLKMDTQGYDLAVLSGAANVLDLIQGLQSEVSVIPLYDGMPHYTDALKQYEAIGFGLMHLFPVGRLPDGRVVEYDCVMMRKAAIA
jgi:FkbM family methyltransferase